MKPQSLTGARRVGREPCIGPRRGTGLAMTAALAAALGLAGACHADEGPRDPMQPPAAARPAVPAADGSVAAATAPRHLMVVDGKRYVIDSGRRRQVGDMLGDARIERIEDSAVVVRQAGTLQRLPLYEGVNKRPVPESSATPSATPASLARPSRPARPASASTSSLPRPQRPQRPGEQP